MIGVREFLGCAVLCLCGLTVGSLAAERFGWLGALLGFIVGVLSVFYITYGVLSAWVRLVQAGPWMPQCHTGKCKGGYEMGDDSDFESLVVDGEVIYHCRCGYDYVLLDGGRRFLERLPDGTLKPYMRHRAFRGWYPDKRAVT